MCHVLWVCPDNITDNETKDILVKSHDYHLHLFQNETSNDVCLDPYTFLDQSSFQSHPL